MAMRAAAVALLFGFAVAVAGAGHVRAEDDYPSRTITFLCPFPAGGGTDILTRLLAEELQSKLGKPVVVDNRVGAGTQIAANATAHSAPDG